MNLLVDARTVKASFFYAKTENDDFVIVAYGEPIALALSDGRVILRLKLTSGGIHQRVLATLDEIRRTDHAIQYADVIEVDETNWRHYEEYAARRPVEFSFMQMPKAPEAPKGWVVVDLPNYPARLP